MNCDVIIIGSGPSAAACHKALLSKNENLDVCILEAGKRQAEYKGHFASQPSENFRLSPSTYLGFGGTSELWHSVLAPMDEVDFESRPEIGSPEWPISLNEMRPHYKHALKFLGVADEDIFEDEARHFSLKELELQGLENEFCPKLFIQLKNRWKASAYWKAVRPKIKLHFTSV